jgi:NADPH:quinone reductase-like Zn-dependent oxidoreductase
MKAIRLTAYGKPALNLQTVDVSEPNAPGAGEALVRMEYAPVDSDLLLANGVYFLRPAPLRSSGVKVPELSKRSDPE